MKIEQLAKWITRYFTQLLYSSMKAKIKMKCNKVVQIGQISWIMTLSILNWWQRKYCTTENNRVFFSSGSMGKGQLLCMKWIVKLWPNASVSWTSLIYSNKARIIIWNHVSSTGTNNTKNRTNSYGNRLKIGRLGESQKTEHPNLLY